MDRILFLCCVVFSLFLFSSSSGQEKSVVSDDGLTINFLTQGEGEPVIFFVHGFSGDISGWNNQINHFSKKYRVVAIDLPGFGESGNERENWSMDAFGKDVISVIHQLKLSEVILVGHSMGAAVILEAALENSTAIKCLVPCDVYHNVESKATEDFIQRAKSFYGESLENIGWQESFDDYIEWRNNRLANILTKIKTPIICINSDRFPSDVDVARKYSSSFDVKVIEGVGHRVMTEAPDKFNGLLEEIILKFMKTSKN
ncbi:alpha/beta fold hydrolase [Bacteroidota bacterium]